MGMFKILYWPTPQTSYIQSTFGDAISRITMKSPFLFALIRFLALLHLTSALGEAKAVADVLRSKSGFHEGQIEGCLVATFGLSNSFLVDLVKI